MARNPYVGSGRAIEAGALATRKQDFNAHVDGTGFRQGADTVDISAIEGVVGSNVQEALESLNNLITSAGSGFISIGLADGYAQGSYTVGSEGYDTLRDAFNGAVADPRLQNGGVILILAGTYTTTATITVPAGITVLGEMGGTIIIGEMPDTPMFQVEGTGNRIGIGGDDGSGDLSMDTGGKPEGVRFANLMLADNLDGYASFGAPSMTSVPMIRCSVNSHLTCEHVRFIGRMAAGSPPRDATYAAIGYSSGTSSGTHLSLYKCFFDGISTPVLFTAGGGDLDSVVIDHCRARVIGADDDAADQMPENCFVQLTACHASITNNHICPGPHTYIESVIYISASYDDDSKIIISGTKGSGADADPSYGSLVTTNAGVSASVMQHGNNWGRSNGEWYVVAGLDYFGSDAIDKISNLYSGGTVYVMPGTYVATVSAASLSLIGLSGGSSKISLNMTSATTDLFTGNRVFSIYSAKNIYFICDSATTSFYHTVRASKISTTYPDMLIDGCVFDNCSLVVNESTSGNFNTVAVTNCQFYQDGDFACNTSILLPAAKTTKLDNCYFYLNGGGYVGGIGDAGAYDSSMTDSSVTVSNCILNLGNGQIDTSADLSMTHFFWINELTSNVVISNSKIICNDNLNGISAISGVSMSKFVYIKARDIFINDCLFNSPDQSVSGYPVAGVYLEPQASATVTNSKFIGGALLLQIGGTTALSDTTTSSGNGGIVVSGCDFISGDELGFCVFDIDIDLASTPNVLPRIIVDGNHFRGYSSAGTSGLNDVLHSAQTGAHYDVLGVVQIYANMTDVFVTNNKISGIACSDASGSSITEFAGLVVNNSRGDTLSNTHAVSTVVANNVIYLESDYADTISMEDKGVAAVNIETPVLNMTGNIVTLYYYAAASDSYAEVLTVYCNDSSGYGDSMVANNLFSIRSNEGAVGTLVDSYIHVQSTSGRGSIVNNSFSDGSFTDSSGTSTAVIEDDTSSWLISGNKNQINVLPVTNGTGNFSVSTSSTPRLAGFTTSTVASGITGSTTGNTTVVFSYSASDAGSSITFGWFVPGSALPYGVQVTEVELNYELDNAATTTADLTLSISSDAGTDGSLSAIGGLGSATRTTTAALTHINLPENNLRINVIATIDDAGANFITISSLNITYKW